MKPYGYERMGYDARHRIGGDISHGKHPHATTQIKNAERRFKKFTRRFGKVEVDKELNDNGKSES
jgi:ribosomal protein L31